MTGRPSNSDRASRGRQRALVVNLSRREVELLAVLAPYYEKAMGPMRHVVRLTSSRETRERFRFVGEESRWLRRFAEATLQDMRSRNQETADVALTVAALIAFWGRILASLNSHRSRRRLSAEAIAERETLAAKLARSARQLWRETPEIVETELSTRRPAERAWMLETLESTAE